MLAVGVKDEAQAGFRVGNAEGFASTSEDRGVFVLAEFADVDLVAQAAQESLVGKIAWRHVAGEHHDDIKGDDEFHTGVQRKMIHASIQGHDPAVH